MSITNTQTFNFNTYNICVKALKIAGVLGSGETPDTNMMSEARESLNLILQTLPTFAQPLWKIENVSLVWNLSGAPSNYAISGSYADIIGASVLEYDRERELPIITYQAFREIPDKTTNVGNRMIYMSYLKNYNTFDLMYYPNPILSNTYVGTINLRLLKRVSDCNDNSNDVEIPVTYYQMLIYNLALDLAYQFQRDANTIQLLDIRTKQYIKEFKNHNSRREDLRFVEGAY